MKNVWLFFVLDERLDMFSGPVKKPVKIVFECEERGYRQFGDGRDPGETGLSPLKVSAQDGWSWHLLSQEGRDEGGWDL